MISIVFIKARISHNQFKCNYATNKNFFLNVLLRFWNLHEILNILEQKIIPHSLSICDIIDCEERCNLNI